MSGVNISMHQLEQTPEGPTVQLTGTLMALPCVLLLMRRPNYSSLHAGVIMSRLDLRWMLQTQQQQKAEQGKPVHLTVMYTDGMVLLQVAPRGQLEAPAPVPLTAKAGDRPHHHLLGQVCIVPVNGRPAHASCLSRRWYHLPVHSCVDVGSLSWTLLKLYLLLIRSMTRIYRYWGGPWHGL